MISLLGIALGGGALAAAAQQRRRPTLTDLLTAPGPSPASQGQAPPACATGPLAPVRACLAWLDGRYQALVQARLDPWLAGRLRDRQIQALARGARRELTPLEKQTNRGLVPGAGGLGLIALARMTGWPLIPAVVAIGVYTAWPALQEAWRVAPGHTAAGSSGSGLEAAGT